MRKYKENAALRAKFKKRAEKLEDLSFKAGDFLIRPARSQRELICEGKTLNHCVGSYAERMATGKTAIFFIRRSDAPDIPYFTLEFCEGRVSQCRGYKNDSYITVPEVEAFVKAWLGYLDKKKGAAA